MMDKDMLTAMICTKSPITRISRTLILTGTLILAGCLNKGVHSAAGKGDTRAVVHKASVGSPLSVQIYNPTRLASISSLGVLQPQLSNTVIDPGLSVEGLYELVMSRANEALALKVVRASPKERTDAVLKTEIVTFKDRSGSLVGGEPATVAFTMTVSRISDQAELWRANYFYRQEALSDNWLKIGERFGSDGTGPGWRSGRELLDRGISSAIEDFATRREQQFLSAPAR